MNKSYKTKADELWGRLRDAFNKEAEHYDPETNTSRLGSIGDKKDREVMRSMWWSLLRKDLPEEDYDILTHMIESKHGGEQLETGRISFGS